MAPAGSHSLPSNLQRAIAGRAYELSPQQQKATLAHHLQAMWDLGHCDKKRCTGTRLMRLHVVSEMRLGTPFPGVILSPNGKRCVSVEDQELIAAKGLAVVDCSWNRLDDVPFSEPACGKGVADRDAEGLAVGWQWWTAPETGQRLCSSVSLPLELLSDWLGGIRGPCVGLYVLLSLAACRLGLAPGALGLCHRLGACRRRLALLALRVSTSQMPLLS